MANQVIARLVGDDYQHLFSWHKVLELLRPATTVERVRLEDEDAMSIDDVTVDHLGSETEYFQVKCHVDHRSGYGESSLTEVNGKKSSLLQKWHRSFRKIRDSRGGALPIIYLVSNWGWVQEDVLPGFICGIQESIKDHFYSEGPHSNAGKLRRQLAEHLGIDDDELQEFLRSLRFQVAFGSLNDLTDRIAERMEHLGLKSDEASLLVAAGAVREWIKNGPVELNADLVKSRITELGLWLPADAPSAVHVHLLTIKEQRFDIEPDYRLDWRDFFVGPPNCKGHEVFSPETWNDRLMPELLALEQQINRSTNTRFLRVRGKSRLSAWMAFGYIFSQVNGYALEVEQNGKMWNTSVVPALDIRLASTNGDGEIIDAQGDSVAVGISVSSVLEEDVRCDLARHGYGVRAFLHLQPFPKVGALSVRDGCDAIALAGQAKVIMRDFVRKHKARRLLLYFCGPSGGAAFIGYQLNAVCPQIQLMEHIGEPDKLYAPSFLLGAM